MEQYSDALSTAELAHLVEKREGPALVRFTLHMGGLLASVAGCAFADDARVRIACAVVCAVLWSGLFAMLHETLHLTAFKSRALNEVAYYASSFLLFFVAGPERELHFEHHRYSHDPARDPELSVDGEKLARGPTHITNWLFMSSGLPLIIARLVMLPALMLGLPILLARAERAPKLVRMPWIRERYRVRGVIEAWLFAAAYAACYAACYAAVVVGGVHWHEVAIAFLAGQAILAMYQQCEHRGLEPRGDIFARTRSIRTNAFVRWLFWNMPWHAEHHAYPAVPFHALAALHEKLTPRLVHGDKGFTALTWESFRKAFRLLP